MPLSNDLISQFVKSTRDDTKTKSESTVYGTIRKYDEDDFDGSTLYVQLDNTDPDLLTPVKASSVYMDKTNVKEGERVMVLIKNHSATITGNLSSPAARDDEVKDIGKKLDDLDVSHITVDYLDAKYATIDSLKATNVKIENLSATYATINSLEAVDARIDNLGATYATIKSLEAINANINNLSATYATITSVDAITARINKLGATYATIESLDATNARIDNLGATYATITNLNAAKGNISDLTADVAEINTLMFGSATGNAIQTSFANAVIAQLGNAQIKSAMIESVSASKIAAGDIITNNVKVKSQNGKLIISDETIQISDSTRVRVQIGKDASNDYSINIWDESGNLMFSEGGITDKAIKDAIIRNDMVSDTANIAAHKLDIDSLFDEINDSTNTIKSTKVYLDDKKQTLDVAFTSLSTTVGELQNGVSSQGTQISVIQGQITSKVWQQDITNATNELGEQTETLSTNYSELKQQVDGLSTTVSSNSTAISKKADNTTVTNVTNRVSSLETGLSGFQSTVSETYATKTEVDSVSVGGRNLLLGADNAVENSNYGLTGYAYADPTQIVAGKEYTVSFDGMLSDPVQTGFYINTYPSPYPQCVIIPAIATDGEYHHYEATFIMPNNGSYTSLGVYSNTPGNNKLAGVKNIKLEKGNRATDWTLAPEDVDKSIATAKQSGDNAQSAVDALEAVVSNAKTQISQNTEAIKLRAIATDVENKFKNYSTTTEMQSAIEVKADSITNHVSSVYATKENVDAIEIGGRNLLENSAGPFTTTSGREFLNTGHDLYPIFTEHGLIQYTISMDMKSPDDIESGNIQVYIQNGSGSYHTFSKTFNVTNEWTRYSFTFIPTENTDFTDKRSLLAFYGTYNTGNFPSVKNIKLEKGNKATDWTPAPEDVDAEITNLDSRMSSAESSITQLSNKITTNVTETTNLGTRMATVEQTASGLTTRLDSQTIGGTNILRSTNTVEDFVSSALWSNGTWRTAGSTTGARTVIDISDAPNGDIAKGFSITGDGSDVTTCQDRVPITSGLTYTMSCYARGTGILRFQVGRSPYSYKTCTLNNVTTWTKYSYTFVAGDGNGITDGVTNVYFGNRGTDTIEICGLKMELGNVATDWTPSPYDTTSGIETASKTATNYLGFSSGGLIVGDMTKDTLGSNVLIDTDSVDIRNNTTTLASFGANYLYLAKNSRNATIDMCNGLATMYHASKYSYDSLFVIDTAVVEIIGANTPLCLTSTSSLENVSIQFANSSKVLGGIGIIGSWLRRYGSNMYDTYTLLDSGNFHDVMDSGWVYCTYGDGFTRYSNSQANIQVRKIGKQVYLRGEAKPTTAVTPESETSTVLAVIPEGYRPSYRQNFVMQGSSAYRWLMSVYPGGNICISRYTNDTTMNKSISAGAWLCCYAQWTID